MSNNNANYLLIVCPATHEFILIAQDNNWSLPQSTQLDLAQLVLEIEEQLGLSVIFLGSIYTHNDEEDEANQYRIFLFESRKGTSRTLLQGQWRPLAKLPTHPLTPPKHQEVLQQWLVSKKDSQNEESLIPWQQSGWFDEASDWIQHRSRSAGLNIQGHVQQKYFRIWSCILHAATQQGDIYFKSTIPSCDYEARLTAELYDVWPQHMPEVIAYHPKRSWLLMHDAGVNLGKTMLVDKDANPQYYEEVLAIYARIQQESIQYQTQLLTAGCPDYSLSCLPNLYQTLVQDREALGVDQAYGVSASEFEQLQAFTPDVEAMCTALQDIGVSETIHHDDLWCGNIMNKGGRYIFFDWAESAFGHPFCSLYTLLKHAKHMLGYDQATLDRLRDNYLAHWKHYASAEQLMTGFHIAQRLALFYRALTWHTIFQGVPKEVRGLYANEVPAYMLSFLSGKVWE